MAQRLSRAALGLMTVLGVTPVHCSLEGLDSLTTGNGPFTKLVTTVVPAASY